MKLLILTVCPQGAKNSEGKYHQFSFRIDNPPDRASIKKLFVNLSGYDIDVPNHQTYIQHGRLICTEINEFIIFNQLHSYFKNQPTRLIFSFSERVDGSIHKYVLYQPQGV